MSEVPPNTMTEPGRPKASFTGPGRFGCRAAGTDRTAGSRRGRPAGTPPRSRRASDTSLANVERSSRESLARSTRPPASATSSSRCRRAAGSAGGPTGTSRASVQPSIGKLRGPGSPGPNRLRTAMVQGVDASCSASMRPGDQFPVLVADHELVLDETAPAEQTVPVGHRVERVEEPAQPAQPARTARALAEPELVEGGDRQRVDQAPGEVRREAESRQPGGARGSPGRRPPRSAEVAWSPASRRPRPNRLPRAEQSSQATV